MDKAYDHKAHEDKIYKLWENSGAFSPKSPATHKPQLKTYTILMPPPNANASLHAGHAMYTVDDILIRFKRMQGFASEWIPGTDHAGFETQFVYEKHLAKEGKSRFDFDRNTLYKNIYEFVQNNSGLIFEQMKQLGFSADWERSVFTLDPHVISQVFETFKKMESEGLVYRDAYIVNYCVHDGTSLAELEVKHVERVDPLYFIKYPLLGGNGYVTVATVRPEPIFADTHLAVNPNDNKNKHFIGQKVKNPLTDATMEIIADEYVDAEFGTGIVKLTPAHDANDFAVAQKNNLPIVPAIDRYGRILENGGKYAGLKVKVAREQVVENLTKKGLIEKIDKNYLHSVITCYKCGRDLEPLTVPNWFIKVASLKKEVARVVEKDQVQFYPKKYKRHMLTWLEIMHDWPISRQIVWGIRIPVWYDSTKNPDLDIVFLNNKKEIVKGKLSQILEKYHLSEVKDGLQTLQASKNAEYVVSESAPASNFLQETDTFDTWFSSGQWPLVTSTTYPSDVMATYADILKFWVSRMIMFGLYLKNEIPFKQVYLWSMVADSKGMKMSKSKGNVINPINLVDKYGADALRMSLIYGIPAGSKVVLSEQKVKGMRNFSNKIWNATRYVQEITNNKNQILKNTKDKEINNKIKEITKTVTNYLENLKLDKAAEILYDEFWHWFCDEAIELHKKGEVSFKTLNSALKIFLILLHPFAPFVTEASYQEVFAKDKDDLLISASWPI